MDTANPYASPAVPYGSYPPPAPAVAVSEGTIRELEGTRPWVRFIAILTWIGSGLMVLVSLGLIVAGIFGVGGGGLESGGASMGMGVGYLILSLLVIYPALKMSAYAKWIGSLTSSRAVGDLEIALLQQRQLWRFYGILMAIYLVLVVLGVGAAVVLPLLLNR